ncbi:MAG: hypothetical protein WBO70_02405 [Erysipelotrichaceae bacterium]
MDKKQFIQRLLVVLIFEAMVVISGFIYGVHFNSLKPGILIYWVDFFVGIAIFPLVALLTYKLPKKYFVMVIYFCFVSVFLGMILNYYMKFWWWDIFLHANSGVFIAYFGYYFYDVMCNKFNQSINRFMAHIFVLLFVFALAGLWEIYEFTVDSFFGLNSQLGSLSDTMSDMIYGSIGGIIVIVYYMVRDRIKIK